LFFITTIEGQVTAKEKEEDDTHGPAVNGFVIGLLKKDLRRDVT